MVHPTSRADWLLSSILFAMPFLYCVAGAVRGQLFIPHHHSYGNDVFAGVALLLASNRLPTITSA